MKRTLKLLLVAVLYACTVACNDSDYDWQMPEPQLSQAPETLAQVWATSPFAADMTARNEAFDIIQTYADICTSATFSTFLSGEGALYDSLVKYEDILACYNAAFDRVLEGLKNDVPQTGEVHVWMLYNMGYVIKTPSGCFAVDIYHRRAAELAPHIDFYCITHVHQDHKSQPLIDAMLKAGKPVVQNFLEEPGYAYTATETKDYTIGKFELHTFITNHNNGTTNVPVTVFQIDCGDDTGHFVMMHSGDSNFRPEQFDVTADIDLYIPRYAPNELTENNVIGKVFSPKYVLLSHILELSHSDPDSSRWSLKQGLARAAQLDCEHSYMPFWGEKMVWKNDKLN